jgi:Fe2+ or Zn2+ uptake regulation protein
MDGVMTDALFDEELIGALRERGQRVTLPRLLVHRHVRRQDRHVTPEQVHAELSPQLPSLSPATIYGTLDLLDDLGFVRRISTPRGGFVYDSRVEDHHHAICRQCGRVQDLEAPLDAAAVEQAARAAGFQPAHAQLTVSGLCDACARG